MFERCATQKQKLLISSEERLNLTAVHVAEIPGSIPGYGTNIFFYLKIFIYICIVKLKNIKK